MILWCRKERHYMKKQQRRKISQIEIVTASDPAELQDGINAVLLQHPDVTDISIEPDRAMIQYTITVESPAAAQIETGLPIVPVHSISFADNPDPDEVSHFAIELILPKDPDRFCCECTNYSWGKGCPYREGIVRNMDKSCQMFNVNITFDGLEPTRISNQFKTLDDTDNTKQIEMNKEEV